MKYLGKQSLKRMQKLSFLPSIIHEFYRGEPEGSYVQLYLYYSIKKLLKHFFLQQLPVVARGFMESDSKMPPLVYSLSVSGGSCG